MSNNTISSSTETAGRLASGIIDGVQAISQIQMVTKDTQSIISGNASSHEAIDGLQSVLNAVADAVITDANNLKSAASEFEAANEAVRRVIINAP